MRLDPATGWCHGVRHCPSPNFNERPAGEISLLVIHNISLPPGQFGTGKVQEFFQNRLDVTEHPYFAGIADLRVSAHFLIERDGAVTQFVSCLDRAWHAGVSSFQGRETCNDFSLGIELEGTDDQPFSDAQYHSLISLSRQLRRAFSDITPQRICGHSDIAPGPGIRLGTLSCRLGEGGRTMSFLVLLLAVWIEKFSALRQRVQRDGWWLGELARLESSPRMAGHPWWLLIVMVLLPVALLGLLLLVLEPIAYGLLALPVHLLVVIYALGRGDLLGELGPFRDAWRREDLQAAAHVAERDLGICAENGEQLLERVQGHLLWQAFQSFFAVIFWYFLLGPVAALSYRLLALAAEHGKNPALVERAGQLRHAFDWLPVRLLAASFALVGNFVAVGRVMLHELLNWHIGAAQLVEKVGLVAAEIPPPEVGPEGINSLDRIWELLLRAAVLWYAGFALWTVLA